MTREGFTLCHLTQEPRDPDTIAEEDNAASTMNPAYGIADSYLSSSNTVSRINGLYKTKHGILEHGIESRKIEHYIGTLNSNCRPDSEERRKITMRCG